MKLNKIHCFTFGSCKKWGINGSRVVDLENDFATINKTVGEAGCSFSGLIYWELKDSSKMMEIHIQILHYTDLGQWFDPILWEEHPSRETWRSAPALCLCGDALQPGERHPRAEESTGLPPLYT